MENWVWVVYAQRPLLSEVFDAMINSGLKKSRVLIEIAVFSAACSTGLGKRRECKPGMRPAKSIPSLRAPSTGLGKRRECRPGMRPAR